MLDHPATYSEQETRDIINQDEDTRDTYHLLVEAICSSRQTDTPVDNNSTHRGGAGKGSAEVVGDSTIVFDNVPLDQMLPQIADYYHVTVGFRNSDAHQLVFHFVWKPEDKVEVLIKKLNHFERLKVELKSNKIVVE